MVEKANKPRKEEVVSREYTINLHKRLHGCCSNNMKDTILVEESSVQAPVCKKRKRRVGKRKIEFIGWGSRPLIEFLEAIGQDTREKHSRQEVAAFISKYINDKSLASAEKKKKIICDERLFALFGKKSVPRIKVYDMLEEHFAENHDDSDDELLDSSDEDNGEKKFSELKKIPTGPVKKALKTRKSCFASVIPENIKLIYLKRSVIQELLKFPESFEFKIVGSFVKMKSDPYDIYQKNPFQLQQVTGLEKFSVAGDADIEIHLRLSNFFKDVPICMLSDDNFTEEEVEDVRDRIKAGSLNRLTVSELQSKAEVLHADITNNWIAKQISLLQKLADHANEKGRQKEKFDHLERRKMLQKPSEQEKLLFKLPEVIAEELEPEVTVADASEKAEISDCSPKSILRESSEVSSTDASGPGEIGTPPKVILGDPHALKVQNGSIHGVVQVPPEQRKAYTVEQGKLVLKVTCDESARAMQRQDVGSGKKHPQEEPEQPLSTTGVISGPNVMQMQDIGSGKNCPQGEPEQPPSTNGIISGPNVMQMQDVGSGKKHPQEEPKQPPSRTAVVFGIDLSCAESSIEMKVVQMQDVGSRKKHPQRELEQPPSENGVISGPNVMQMQDAGSRKKHPYGEPKQPLSRTAVVFGIDLSCAESSMKMKLVTGSGEKGKAEQRPSSTVVIELSDDESEDDGLKVVGRRNGEDPNEAVWNYLDPQGNIQGPFTLLLLKQWNDKNYFRSGFKVWKSGLTSNDGVLLLDLLRRTLPH